MHRALELKKKSLKEVQGKSIKKSLALFTLLFLP